MGKCREFGQFSEGRVRLLSRQRHQMYPAGPSAEPPVSALEWMLDGDHPPNAIQHVSLRCRVQHLLDVLC